MLLRGKPRNRLRHFPDPQRRGQLVSFWGYLHRAKVRRVTKSASDGFPALAFSFIKPPGFDQLVSNPPSAIFGERRVVAGHAPVRALALPNGYLCSGERSLSLGAAHNQAPFCG